MKICAPAKNTCNKCWKYRNELGGILRLENSSARDQNQTESNLLDGLVDEGEEKVDGNSTDSSNDHDNNSSNNEV